MRKLLADDEIDQTVHLHVFAALRYLARERIEIGRPVTYVDATHLTRRERKPYIELALETGCLVEALYFDTPLKVCLERNRQRARVVPEGEIRKMADKLVPPKMEEGFARVVVVRGDL